LDYPVLNKVRIDQLKPTPLGEKKVN
jgi:hypothetical protein